MRVTGKVTKVLWRNYSSQVGNNHIVQIATRGGTETIAGRFPMLRAGEIITVEVDENTDPKQVATWKFEIYHTLDSLRQILKQVKGIGEKTASEIINQIARKKGLTTTYWLLEDFIPILEEMNFPNKNEVIRLLQLYSIADEIGAVLGQYTSTREFLNAAKRIIEDDRVDEVKNNYYLLVDYVFNCPIHRLDEYMRTQLSFKIDSPERIEAFIKYTLNSFARQKKITKVNVTDFIRLMQYRSKLDVKTIKDTLDELNGGSVIYDGHYVSSYNIRKMEEECAQRLNEISNAQIKHHIDEHFLHSLIQKYSPFPLDDLQINAIKESFYNKVHLITGGPGTGKSTVLSIIYKIAMALGYNPIVLTPTGKAADRLKDVGAKTVHFTLGWDGRECRKTIHNDFIILDEASMLDLETFWNLLTHTDETPTLVIVGDANQLQPVDAGCVFYDMIKSKRFAVTVLKDIYRQGTGSKIIELAGRVMKRDLGRMLALLKDSKEIIVLNKSRNPQGVLLKLYSRLYEANPHGSFVILTPLRNEGLKYSATNINNKLKKLNGPKRVMCVENDYTRQVYNGETGYIARMSSDTISVNFGDKLVEYTPLDYDIYIDYAYAMTVHKAQGSEYDIVILPLFYEHVKYWTPKLLYTAITRTKKKLVLIVDSNLTNLLSNILYKREIQPVSYFAECLEQFDREEVCNIES